MLEAQSIFCQLTKYTQRHRKLVAKTSRQRSETDPWSCFPLTRQGGLWSIRLPCPGQLINPSQLLARWKPHILISDRQPLCIYCDQFHPKISISPLLDVRKINSEGKFQTSSCHIKKNKQIRMKKTYCTDLFLFAPNSKGTVWLGEERRPCYALSILPAGSLLPQCHSYCRP